MIEDKKRFSDALKIVLMEDGLNLSAGADIFIRSLEGEQFCVGTLDREGGIDDEALYVGEPDEAIKKFIEMVEELNLC